MTEDIEALVAAVRELEADRRAISGELAAKPARQTKAARP